MAPAFVAGCSTSYGPVTENSHAGYSHTRLAENVFEVRFFAVQVGPERIGDYVLLRGAELALEEGYAYFSFVDRASKERFGSIEFPAPVSAPDEAEATCEGWNSYSVASTAANNPILIVTAGQQPPTWFFTKKTFVFFQMKPEGILAFDARFVADEIRTKYAMKND